MMENKEKLVAYLNKQLAIAEKAFEEIDAVDQAIEELKTKMIDLMAKRDLLGDKESAARDVAEIKGFIDSLCVVEAEASDAEKVTEEAVVEEIVTEPAVEEIEEAVVEETVAEDSVEEVVEEVAAEETVEKNPLKTFLGV